MHGQPPTAAQVPPSVQRARQHPHRAGKRAWTGLWGTRILAILVGLTLVAMVVAKVVATMQAKPPQKAATESTMDPYWGRRPFSIRRRSRRRRAEEKKPGGYHGRRDGRPAPSDGRHRAGTRGAEKPQDADHDRENQGDTRPRIDAGAHPVYLPCPPRTRPRRSPVASPPTRCTRAPSCPVRLKQR